MNWLSTLLQFIGLRQAARQSGASAKEANQEAALVVLAQEAAKKEAEKKE